MVLKSQAARLTDVIADLENCIHSIVNTGNLSDWMSPDGIALLKNTLMRTEKRKPTLERLINTPPGEVIAHFVGQNLNSEIENYENLLFHLTETLKIARSHQDPSNPQHLAPPTKAR